MIRLIPIPALAVLSLSLGLAATPTVTAAAELQPQTVKAFERHVAAESWQTKAVEGGQPFLWVVSDSGRRQLLQNGEIVVDPGSGKGDTAVNKGLVHHWIGGVFVPGHTAADALELLRDFDAYKRVYAGSVEDSKKLSRDGDVYRTFLRLRKHRVVTVVLNTEYDVEFQQLDAKRWYSRSSSTRIAQVKDAGSPDEREMPVGDDSGYLWRIVTFWRLEEADGGVYLECEVLGLTRAVPYGLGWLVRPIIRSFPRESLFETLSETRSALLARGGPEAARDLSKVSQARKADQPATLAKNPL